MGLWYYVLGRRKQVNQCLKIEPGRHRHDKENVPTQKGKMFCAGFCFAFFNFLGKIFRKWLTIRQSAGIITPVVRHGTDIWGISSAGRALAWHARGHRFDPGILHHKDPTEISAGSFLLHISACMGENRACRRNFQKPLAFCAGVWYYTKAIHTHCAVFLCLFCGKTPKG